MKDALKNIIVIGSGTFCCSLLLAPLQAQARWWHQHCTDTSSMTLIGEQVLSYEGGCEPGAKLALARGSHIYPAMKGTSYEVSYWRGSYARRAIVQETYRRDFYDSCSGVFEFSDYVTPPPAEKQFDFPVDNPNLHDDVRESFALAPMTDNEANTALLAAKSACEQATR